MFDKNVVELKYTPGQGVIKPCFLIRKSTCEIIKNLILNSFTVSSTKKMHLQVKFM